MTTGRKVHILTTAELDIMKAEARTGAFWSEEDKVYIVDVAGVRAFGETPAEAFKEFRVAMTLMIESLTDREAAEDQRQRDEGYNEGVAASAKVVEGKICSYMDGDEVAKLADGKPYCTDIGDAILALRRQP